MNTKNVLIPESRRAGDVPSLLPIAGPPGPASAGPPAAGPGGPGKPFAAVIEQALERKSSDSRSADSRPAHVRTTRSSGAGRRAEPASSEAAPARTGRAGRHLADGNSSAAGAVGDRSTVGVSSNSVIEPPVEQGVRAGDAQEQADVVDSELNPSEMVVEEKIEEKAADVPPNIIAFPGMVVAQSVIIPFPLAAAKAMSPGYGAVDGNELNDGAAMAAEGVATGLVEGFEGKIVQLPNATMPKAGGVVAVAEPSAATGIDVTKLGMELVKQAQWETKLPPVIAEEGISPTETVASAFGEEVPAKSDSPGVLESAAARESEGSGEQAESQLPDESGLQEETAGRDERSAPLGKDGPARLEAVKGPVHTGLAGFKNVEAAAAGSAGIGAARQESRMESFSNSERVSASGQGAFDALEEFQPTASEALPDNGRDLSARNLVATEWQMERPVSSIDRSAPSSTSAAPVDAAATVERISKLLMVETALVRKHGSDAMAVVLRPDAETELFVHFTQRNGQVEASIRCERGDAQHLSALWPQLQESLAQQKVRLAPLQESPSNQSNFNQPNGSGRGGGENGSSRQAPQDKQFMDERPVPASSETSAPHVRGNGGSRHRRVTTSRPGWETWA